MFSWAILYFPPLNTVLGTGPVAWQVYAIAWAGIPLIFGLDYARKRIAMPLAMTAARQRDGRNARSRVCLDPTSG